MTKTKYFVIRCDAEDERIYCVADTLKEARDEAEQNALTYPKRRFLIAAEVQSVFMRDGSVWFHPYSGAPPICEVARDQEEF